MFTDNPARERRYAPSPSPVGRTPTAPPAIPPVTPPNDPVIPVSPNRRPYKDPLAPTFPISPNYNPRVDPLDKESFDDPNKPIGRDSEDRVKGNILLRHLSLFSGLRLEDFITFLPPNSGVGIIWPDATENKHLLATIEGRASIDRSLRTSKRIDILKQNIENIKQYKKENSLTPKIDGLTILTSPRIAPNTPGTVRGSYRAKYDRRMRGRSTMAATLPPEIAEIASSTKKESGTFFPETIKKAPIMANVGIVNEDSYDVTRAAYEK